jgi:hypothetical protein
MSNTWNRLVNWQENAVSYIDTKAERVDEPGMDRFNQPGWINIVWSADWARRIHLDVVDARETRGLWMMHFCIFPHLDNPGPIFGLDVIAGKNKVTGFFHDFSPTVDARNQLIYNFGDVLSDYTWKKERSLPEWAQAIFSKHMLAVGNINTDEELLNLLELSFNNLCDYSKDIKLYSRLCDPKLGKFAQNRYAQYQKQNPHTPRTMAALGLNEEDVQVFIQECLFPEIP